MKERRKYQTNCQVKKVKEMLIYMMFSPKRTIFNIFTQL